MLSTGGPTEPIVHPEMDPRWFGRARAYFTRPRQKRSIRSRPFSMFAMLVA